MIFGIGMLRSFEGELPSVGHGNGGLVVALDFEGSVEGETSLLEEVVDPSGLASNMAECDALCFHSRTSSNFLLLAGPRERSPAEEEDVTSGGPASGGFSGPVSIGVPENMLRRIAEITPVDEAGCNLADYDYNFTRSCWFSDYSDYIFRTS